VVHVTYEDVAAYAQWIGKEISTEAEWEFAAWGGRENIEFAKCELGSICCPRKLRQYSKRLETWDDMVIEMQP
jgi:hypothetical protein